MMPSSLEGWLDHISHQHGQVIDMGLDRVRLVLERLGVDRARLGRVITVAGTNGKGSTVAVLDRVLRAQGFRVGTYTSPHLLRYNERVRLDGTDLDDQALCEGFAQVETARGNTPLTYFEFGTLAAIVCFARAGVDFTILEVGLGGRLDAVNVIDPDLAIITTVDIDHVDWLGNDREVIGREKAGILRPGIPFVCGDQLPPNSLKEQVELLGCSGYWRNHDFSIEEADVTQPAHVPGQWNWIGQAGSDHQSLRRNGLPGLSIPRDNVAAALQALALLEVLPDEATLGGILKDISVPGRFYEVARQPHVLLDVGHNPQAARYLADRIRQVGGRWRAVYSGLVDKDIVQVLSELSGAVLEWYSAPLDCERAATQKLLAESFAKAGVTQVHWASTVSEAFRQALEDVQAGEHVLVFGSFFTVAAVLQLVQDEPSLLAQGSR